MATILLKIANQRREDVELARSLVTVDDLKVKGEAIRAELGNPLNLHQVCRLYPMNTEITVFKTY